MIGGTQDNGTECLGYCAGAAAGVWRRGDGGDGGFTGIDQNSATVTNTVSYHTYYNQTGGQIGYARSDNPGSGFAFFYGCGGTANGISCSDNTLFYCPIALGPGAPNTIYLGSDRLYRSPDKGVTATLVSQGPLVSGQEVSVHRVSPQDDNFRLVGLTATGGLVDHGRHPPP